MFMSSILSFLKHPVRHVAVIIRAITVIIFFVTFYSSLCGTGSYPFVPKGLHFRTLLIPSFNPFIVPYSCSASFV